MQLYEQLQLKKKISGYEKDKLRYKNLLKNYNSNLDIFQKETPQMKFKKIVQQQHIKPKKQTIKLEEPKKIQRKNKNSEIFFEKKKIQNLIDQNQITPYQQRRLIFIDNAHIKNQQEINLVAISAKNSDQNIINQYFNVSLMKQKKSQPKILGSQTLNCLKNNYSKNYEYKKVTNYNKTNDIFDKIDKQSVKFKYQSDKLRSSNSFKTQRQTFSKHFDIDQIYNKIENIQKETYRFFNKTTNYRFEGCKQQNIYSQRVNSLYHKQPMMVYEETPANKKLKTQIIKQINNQ